MRLRWWLNPVAAVEAETGWPDDLCESFVGNRAMVLETSIGIAWLVCFAAMMIFRLLVAAGWVVETPWARRAWAALILGLFALLVLSMLVSRVVWGLRARRALPRFLEAPWCLKCRYPIGARADECVRCPECGYGIRWQIAELTEERAKRYADSA